MIFVLSLTCGIRAQIFRMEVKIRAFLPAGIRGKDMMGRNSATGSPRRSITIMPPSAASRTNSEVWMWSSRMEVFLIMLHCSTGADSGRSAQAGAPLLAGACDLHQRGLVGLLGDLGA